MDVQTFGKNQQNSVVPTNINKFVRQTFIDQYIQEWRGSLDSSNKSKMYQIYKSDYGIEQYFKSLKQSDALAMFKYRTANHKLPIETGRWDGTALTDRKCNLCDRNDIGSEKHYLLTCPYFSDDRAKYLSDTDSESSRMSIVLNC